MLVSPSAARNLTLSLRIAYFVTIVSSAVWLAMHMRLGKSVAEGATHLLAAQNASLFICVALLLLAAYVCTAAGMTVERVRFLRLTSEVAFSMERPLWFRYSQGFIVSCVLAFLISIGFLIGYPRWLSDAQLELQHWFVSCFR